MEALFGGFSRTMPLCKLTFSGFNVRGSLAPLIKTLRFFPNLRKLRLEKLNMDENDQCYLLKSFEFICNLTELSLCIHRWSDLDSFHYCSSKLNTFDRLTHGRVEMRLNVNGISLTPAVAAVLGLLLVEMSSLQTLEVTGLDASILKAEKMEVLFDRFKETSPLALNRNHFFPNLRELNLEDLDMGELQVLQLTRMDGIILQAEEMEALFGGFNKPMPLYQLTLNGFSVGGCLAPVFKSLRFFPNLIVLDLEKLSMDEDDLNYLLENFQFIPNLQDLNLSGNPLGHAVTSIVPHIINLKKLRWLSIDNTGHSEEDVNYVRDTLQEALPELRITPDITKNHPKHHYDDDDDDDDDDGDDDDGGDYDDDDDGGDDDGDDDG